MKNARLLSVFSLPEDTATRFAQEWKCKAYHTLEAFLADKDLDVVTIATPSGMHLEPAVAAAEHGKHVICEKPLEVTLERVDRMIAAHDKAGTKLGGVFNCRYEPVNRAIKSLMAAGQLGRVVFAGGCVPWHRTQEYYASGGWRGTWKYDGGGALMNQGIHTADLLQWLVGARVKRIAAFTNLLGHTGLEVEDVMSASLEFENGVLGSLCASTAMWPGSPVRIEIGGTQGTLVAESTILRVLKIRDADAECAGLLEQFSEQAAIRAASDAKAITSDNHRRNFEAFLAALDAGRDPEIDGREARKAVAIVRGVYASAQSGRVIDLD